MVVIPYLNGHSTIFGEVKIRMVATPYLSGLNSVITISYWFQY